MTQPGPCDTVGKGCCDNEATGSHYCTTPGADRLTCDVTPDGDSIGLLCTSCGGQSEPCCLSSSADVMVATPSDLALGPQMCNEEGLGCMIDAGNANSFGKCAPCRVLPVTLGGACGVVWHGSRAGVIPASPRQRAPCRSFIRLDALSGPQSSLCSSRR